MLLNEVLGFTDFSPRQASVLSKLNRWFKPEFGLTILTLDMHMHSGFFAREEVKPKSAFAEYCWTHSANDTRSAFDTFFGAIRLTFRQRLLAERLVGLAQAYSSIGTQLQCRLRSPYTSSMRFTYGQNLFSATHGSGNTA